MVKAKKPIGDLINNLHELNEIYKFEELSSKEFHDYGFHGIKPNKPKVKK